MEDTMLIRSIAKSIKLTDQHKKLVKDELEHHGT